MCKAGAYSERRGERRGSPTIYQKNGVRGVERYRALLLYWESLDALEKRAQRKYGVGCSYTIFFCLFSLRLDCTIALIRAEKLTQGRNGTRNHRELTPFSVDQIQWAKFLKR